ncbi:MAG: hypothetical protein NTAFB05_25000 [Nitrobacter sp.]|uniref:hypothetical protein n=1 Tax=Nitrobacter sp. TaxID=29420 RepID=UPI00387E00C3
MVSTSIRNARRSRQRTYMAETTSAQMPLQRIARHTLSRQALLAGTSAIAILFASAPAVHARSGFGSGGTTIAPPTIASDAATEASQQAAAVAKQAASSLARATQALQALQGVQAAARAAALASQKSATLPTTIPNGLGAGGLLPNPPAGWSGADQPTQSVDASGQTNVTVNQTASQAVLNWTTFNVGALTTLTFNQQGNASWVALNRVDASTGPSKDMGGAEITVGTSKPYRYPRAAQQLYVGLQWVCLRRRPRVRPFRR